MVFSWFKKRGGDDPSAKARKGAGPTVGKGTGTGINIAALATSCILWFEIYDS